MHGLLLLLVVVVMSVIDRMQCMNRMVDDALDQCLTVTANVALACRRLSRLLLGVRAGDGRLSRQPVPKKTKTNEQCKQETIKKNSIEERKIEKPRVIVLTVHKK